MDELAVAEQDAPLPPPSDAVDAEPHGAGAPPTRPVMSREEATDLVLRTVTAHADALLRTARGHSLCADDAHDAYQRALEIFMRRAATLDPATAPRWLHVVVKHEAMAVRRERIALVGVEEPDLDRHEAAPAASPEDRALSAERVTRTTEALQRLKPQELRAMWLKALGNSYEEICRETGWSYTKVNRCLAEGRKTFLERYAGIESGEECARWQPLLSAIVDGEAGPDQLADVRPHLRNCRACRATLRELRAAGPRLAAVLPSGVLALPLADDAPGPGVLSRLAETVTSLFHERAAASALKVQAALDATGVGKVAAVAASAAAVAGGGAAAVHQVRPDRAAADPVPARHSAARPAVRLPAPAVQGPAPSASMSSHRSETAARAGLARPHRHAAPRRRRRASEAAATRPATSASSATQAAIEFAPEPVAPTPSPSPKQPPRPMNGGEFDP